MGGKGRARARRFVAGLLLAAGTALLIVPAASAARPLRGVLDPTFGRDGRVIPKLGDAFAGSHFTSMARQPDGKLVLTATVDTADGGWQGLVERREPTGELDPGFGSGGIVAIPRASHFSEVEGLALQDDGRILLGGQGVVYRLLPDGSLDPGFGNAGVSAKVPLSIRYVTVDAQGRILVAGSAGEIPSGHGQPPRYKLAIVRLQPNGTLDPSFGNGGVVGTHSEDALGEDLPNGLAVREDGTILVAGSRSLLALSANGTLDPNFGKGGVVELPGDPRALLALPDGGAVVASANLPCWGCAASPGAFVLSRYQADGSLDSTFGNGGQAHLEVDDTNEAQALALAPDGSIVLAGGTALSDQCGGGECHFTPILARFTADGALDTGFGQGGWTEVAVPGATLGYGYSPHIQALAISPSGQIFGAGGSGGYSNAFVVAREPSGLPDPGFGSAGSLDEVRTLPSISEAAGLAIEPNGHIRVSAWSNVGAHLAWGTLLGLTAKGTPDREVGSGAGYVGGGRGEPQQGGNVGGGIAGRLQVDRSGHLYVASRTYVLRFDDRGRRDTHYGVKGIARTPNGFRIASFLARPDGRVFALGYVKGRPGMAAFQLAPAGHTDRRFGHNGLAFAGFGVKFKCEAQSAAVDAKGRIVLAGKVGVDAAALRLLPNGRPDDSFGRHGRLGPLPAAAAGETAVRIQPGGGILIAAGPKESAHGRWTSLLRLRNNGGRDRTFGRAGFIRVRGGAPLLALFAGRHHIVLVTARNGKGAGGVILHAYRANGAVDRRFGRQGVATGAGPDGRIFRPTAAARQPSGRIIVAGTAGGIEQSGADVELLRFR